MNYCIISGQITCDPTLRFIRETTMTDFTLALRVNHQPVGRITVICRDSLAMPAAKYLRCKDHVVIEGFLWREKVPWDDGTWTDDLYLMASELLKCEALNLKEELAPDNAQAGHAE